MSGLPRPSSALATRPGTSTKRSSQAAGLESSNGPAGSSLYKRTMAMPTSSHSAVQASDGVQGSTQRRLQSLTSGTASNPSRFLTGTSTVATRPAQPDRLAAQLAQDKAERITAAQLASLQRTISQAEAQIRSLEADVKQKDHKIVSLDSALTVLREKESEREEAEVEESNALASLQESAEQLARERNEWRAQYDAAIAELSGMEARLKQAMHDASQNALQIAHAQKQTSNALAQVSALKQETLRLQTELHAASQERDSLQSSVGKRETQQSDAEQQQRVQDLLQKEIKSQLDRNLSLENDNVKLQKQLAALCESQENTQILREEIRSLESQLKATDALRQQLTAREQDCLELQRERAEWAAYLDEDDTNALKTPRSVTKALASSRIEHAHAIDTLGNVQAELAVKTALIAELEDLVGELECEQVVSSDRYAQAEQHVRHLETSRVTDSREIQLLREQLQTYSSEQANFDAENKYDAQKDKCISELESIIDEQKARIRQLEKEQQLKQQAHMVETPRKTRARLDELLSEQIKKNAQLSTEAARLYSDNMLITKEIDSLQARFDALAAQASDKRIVPASDNATAALELLQRQKDKLLGQLIEYEKERQAETIVTEDGTVINRLVPREEIEQLQERFTNLQSEVEQKDKAKQRLSEAYAQRAMELREAIYAILGWSVKPLGEQQYRLTSAYAPQDHALVYGKSENAGYSLTQGGDTLQGSPELASTMQFWLEQKQNLPGFMASLALTLYDASTNASRAQNIVVS